MNVQTLNASVNKITAVWRIGAKSLTINGVRSDFTVEYLSFFVEGNDHFYMVEIKYSPQAKDSIEIWADLRNMVESFRVLE